MVRNLRMPIKTNRGASPSISAEFFSGPLSRRTAKFIWIYRKDSKISRKAQLFHESFRRIGPMEAPETPGERGVGGVRGGVRKGCW